jgi:hypothetical protein
VNDSVEPVDLSPTRAELIARVRSRGRQIRARRRLGIASIAAVVVVGVAAPAIAIGSSSSPSPQPAASTTTTLRIDLSGDLTTRVELDGNSFVAGGPAIHGTVVITNNTDNPIALDSPGACLGKWAVELTSPAASQHVAWTLDCLSGAPRVVRPGANRFPVTITTTYSECFNQTAKPDPDSVACLPGGLVPPLPPGNYEAVLVTDQPGYLPLAPRVPVRIVAARGAQEFTARIELPGDTFVAGTDVEGTLVVNNPTGHAVTRYAAGCNKWVIVLTNATVPPSAIFTTEGCFGKKVVLAPGANRYPFTLSTSYANCSNAVPPPSPSRHCQPMQSLYPMPIGHYEAVLYSDRSGTVFPTPPPVAVTLRDEPAG